MSASAIVFYVLAVLIIAGGWMAVTERRIFRAAVFLLLSLIGVAGVYFYLNYEFLGAVQIAVYVGGIVVLVIFSVFLTADSGGEMMKPNFYRALFSALASLFACALTLWLIKGHTFKAVEGLAIEPSVRNIGRQMLSTKDYGFILPFEVVSILLLAAMIGCIVIAMKNPAPLQSKQKGS
ncbi:MAG: NADH-quinone oxidoreductase subunit J [Bacteroidia bacterium]